MYILRDQYGALYVSKKTGKVFRYSDMRLAMIAKRVLQAHFEGALKFSVEFA